MPARNATQRSHSQKPGLARACTTCHQKKIKCDLDLGKQPCSNCSLRQTECRPRVRQPRPRRPTASIPRESQYPPDEPALPAADAQPPPASLLSDSSYTVSSWNRRLAPQHRDYDLTNLHVEAEGEANDSSTPTAGLHDGRTMYFGPEGRTVDSGDAYPETNGPSPSDMAHLQSSHVFDLPSQVVQAHYIDNFYKYCFQFAPVVKRSWLEETATFKPSILLLQAVLFTGSRFSSPVNLQNTADLYNKAKTIFFSNHERNPIFLILASTLLQWWNPAGPERISIDNADFWHRIGIGVALQIGLHREKTYHKDAAYCRRLWWVFIARDCQLSSAHGRPRAIATGEFNVSQLTLADFPANDPHALEFINWVAISQIFGALGDYHRSNQKSDTKLRSIGNDLYAWVRELSPFLRLFKLHPEVGLNAYNFVARQLHIIYFGAVTLLLRRTSNGRGSLLAASFTTALFEELLIRDELRFVPAMHKFFLFTAGMTLIPACNTSTRDVSEDYAVIKRALNSFAERHPSTLATLSTLERLSSRGDVRAPTLETSMEESQRMFFREFGPGYCRQWYLYEIDRTNGHIATADAAGWRISPSQQNHAQPHEQHFQDPHTLQQDLVHANNDQAVDNDPSQANKESTDLLWPSSFFDNVDPTTFMLDDWHENWPDISNLIY